jgi:hypothetical protein
MISESGSSRDVPEGSGVPGSDAVVGSPDAPRGVARDGRARVVAALDLLHELREQGIELRLVDGSLRVSAPKGAVSEALRRRITAARDDLITCLAASGARAAQPQTSGDDGSDRTNVSLSYRQQRLWLLQQVQPESTAYNVAYAFRI